MLALRNLITALTVSSITATELSTRVIGQPKKDILLAKGKDEIRKYAGDKKSALSTIDKPDINILTGNPRENS